MNKSDSIKEFAPAFCKFQREVGKIFKTSDNPFYKSKYATLADILDVIRQPLADSGLSIIQNPIGENELETIILHDSGEYMSSSYIMKPVKNDPQGIGSCITYQRRYALGAMLCLNIDEDDDGNKGSGLLQPQQRKPERKQPSRKILTADDLNAETSLKICEWIARKEEKAKKGGEGFSVLALLESAYQIGKKEQDMIINSYNEYKVNNNI